MQLSPVDRAKAAPVAVVVVVITDDDWEMCFISIWLYYFCC